MTRKNEDASKAHQSVDAVKPEPAAPVTEKPTSPKFSAETGTNDGISNRFYGAQQCHVGWHKIALLQGKITLCKHHEQENDAYYQRCKLDMAEQDHELDRNLTLLNKCSNDREKIEKDFLTSTEEAAKAGNVDSGASSVFPR